MDFFPYKIPSVLKRPGARRSVTVLVLALALLAGSGCKHSPISLHDVMYVSAPQTYLRDRVSALYNRVGTIKNGDRLEVLERQKRFVRVRTESGQEGWVELRSLVTSDVYKEFQKLAKENKDSQIQGRGVTRAELNMHVTQGRDTETLFQLAENEKVEILKRATCERATPEQIAAKRAEALAKASGNPLPPARKPKPAPKPANTSAPNQATAGATAANNAPDAKTADLKNATQSNTVPAAPLEPPAKVYDDWWLVRNKAGNVGWVLARMVDLDIPMEVAQYAEGQRIQGAYVLNTVQDAELGKTVSQYLVLFNEPKDGLPYDFNQLRVFVWNLKKHRYETAYRERNIYGYFPAKTGTQDFGRDGVNPTFTVREQNENGTVTGRTYRLLGSLVKQVLAPGEQPQKAAVIPQPEKPEKAKAAKRPRH